MNAIRYYLPLFFVSAIGIVFAMLSSSCQTGRVNSFNPSQVNFSVEYNSVLDGCLYPSMILGLAGRTMPMPEEAALFTIRVTAPRSNAVLRVEVDSSALNYVTILQEVLPESGETYTFHPLLKWKYNALYEMRKSGMIDLTFTCYINDEQIDIRNLRLNYRSANECVISLRDTNGHLFDFRWLFAGYVNEDHPYIDSILTQILDQRMVKSFAGYQMGANMVREQVFAFWYYALERGITYSSITCTSNPSKRANVQRIRFFDEVFNSRQANCVDACVFFASLMRKVGLKPVIFVEPCHAYLGYYTDRKRKNISLLETTITSWVNFPELTRVADSRGHLPDKQYQQVRRYLNEEQQKMYEKGQLTLPQLKEAVARNLFDRASKYDVETNEKNRSNFSDPNVIGYQQLDIENLRNQVQPIN